MDTVHAVERDALGRLLVGRWSCRGFRPELVPREVIEALLGMAQRTPSWCNTQPWQVVLTSGAATRALAEAMTAQQVADPADRRDFAGPEAYRGVYLDRRRECGYALYEAVGVARGDRVASGAQAMENFRLFGAPHFALITTPRDLGVYGAIDCGGYVSVFLLAAQALGLGAVPQAAVAAHAAWLREYFGLGEERRVVCGISFGYADMGHAANGFRTTRAGVGEAVDWRE